MKENTIISDNFLLFHHMNIFDLQFMLNDDMYTSHK
jgi:hypothetical protein